MQNSATIAVPTGVNSLDEITFCCKSRTASCIYIKSDHVKFGICFYAIFGWSHCYHHSLFDTALGNNSGLLQFNIYRTLFRDILGAVHKNVNGTIMSPEEPSPLWYAQAAHQTKIHPQRDHGRLFVMENFYILHILARHLFLLSDAEIEVLGIVQLKHIDTLNRSAIKQAIDAFEQVSIGAWKLCQAFNKPVRGVSIPTVARNTEFIVFEDRAVLVSYIDRLESTPRDPVQDANDHAI